MASFASGFSKGTSKLTSNSNLGFKTGLESALLNITNVQEGCFYLTSDTFRLYLGTKEGTLAPVNQGVISMANLNAITSLSKEQIVAGSFYYASAENILCVHNGTTWVQINPDTYVSSVTAEVTQSQANKKAQVSHTIELSDKTTVNPATFTVEGGDNVAITGAGSNVKIDVHDAEYELATPVADTTKNTVTVGLTKDSANVSNTIFEAKDNITLNVDQEGKIQIGVDLETLTGKVINSATFSNEAKGFKLILTDTTGTEITADVAPQIKYGKNSSAIVDFVNGTAALDVYTADEMDALIKSKFQGLNALTYKGAITDSSSNLPSTNVQIGDVYLQNFKGKLYGNTSYDPGTLWIAQCKAGASEGADGYIASADLEWIPVQNFNADTTYEFEDSVDGNKNTWTQTVTEIKEGNKDIVHTRTLAVDGSLIKMTGSDSQITLSHETHSITETRAGTVSDQSLYMSVQPAITSLSHDTAGHLVSIVEENILVPGVNVTHTEAVSSSTDNEVVITDTAQTKSTSGWTGEESSTTKKYTSSSLKLSAKKDTGGATALNIDLVWGSF